MPTRFYPGVYGPELVEMMGGAFDSAWAEFEPKPANQGLARSLMATSIIAAVELGTRDHHNLVRRATVALITAIKTDPKALGRAAPDANRETSTPARRQMLRAAGLAEAGGA
jgi:hypothetical protein